MIFGLFRQISVSASRSLYESQTRKVSKVTIHPGHNPALLENSIAILHVNILALFWVFLVVFRQFVDFTDALNGHLFGFFPHAIVVVGKGFRQMDR